MHTAVTYSQGRLCTIVDSYGAKSVLVKMALVSFPSTMHILSFLPKISQYLHPFSILHKSIPSGFLFYFCTCLYASAHVLVNSILAHYLQQSPTGVTTVPQLRSIGLCPDNGVDTKIPLFFSPPVYYLPPFSCVVHNIFLVSPLMFFTSSTCRSSSNITPQLRYHPHVKDLLCVFTLHDGS